MSNKILNINGTPVTIMRVTMYHIVIMNSVFHVTLEDTEDGAIAITSDHTYDSSEVITTVMLKEEDDFDDVALAIAHLLGDATSSDNAREKIQALKDQDYKLS